MTYFQEQLSFAGTVNPQGDIVPAWQAFVQARVNKEALAEWGVRGANEAPMPVFEPSRGMSWGQFVREIKGILP